MKENIHILLLEVNGVLLGFCCDEARSSTPLNVISHPKVVGFDNLTKFPIKFPQTDRKS